jgi:hypothetical protein
MIQIENEEPVAPATEGKETFKVGVHSANSVLPQGRESIFCFRKKTGLTNPS